jgi:translation initiation factor 1
VRATSLCPPKRIAGGQKAASFAALGGLVFSTDAGRHCPDCSKPVDACICKQTVIPAGGRHCPRASRKQGRGGTVTTITGVPLAEDALKELATTLKNAAAPVGR